MSWYLGIDIGTTAVKVAAVDHAGLCVRYCEAALTTIRERAGWSEQNPDAWVEATRIALAELASFMPSGLSRVLAIGFSGQMHGLVVLGDDKQPLRNAMLWNDSRAVDEANELNRNGPALASALGVPATPSFLAPKWLWLTRNEPKIAQSSRHILLPKDYVRLKLTGALSTDVVDASGAWLLDQTTRNWSIEALAISCLPVDLLPSLHESCAIVGEVTQAASEYFRLPKGIPVVVGAGDAAAGCVGLHLVRSGQAFINLGTSSQIFVTSDRHEPSPSEMIHSFSHALPDLWFQMAALLNGAGVLGWLAELFKDKPETLALEASTSWSANTPLCLPYFSGERTPHNNPHASGVFVGLSPSTNRAELAASVLDGIALSLRDAFQIVSKGKSQFESIGITGGGARDHYWLKMIASALEIPVEVFGGAASGAAAGAALLARSIDVPIQTLEPLRPTMRVDPDQHMTEVMVLRHLKFQKLYTALKGDFFSAGPS